MKTKETCSTNEIRFDKERLMPVIVQEYETKKVLMLAYASRRAVDITLKTGLATFWSRSRQRIWVKGEISGNLLKVMSVLADCDGDTLLYIVKLPKCGGACHEEDEKGNRRESCFFRMLKIGAR